MKCMTCNDTIDSGEQRDHFGQTLCEDCYMDAVFKVKACDPWAVHSAKSHRKFHRGEMRFTELQEKILRVLKEIGAVRPAHLLEKLGDNLKLEDLEREFASLRHMEIARAFKKNRKVFWRIW